MGRPDLKILPWEKFHPFSHRTEYTPHSLEQALKTVAVGNWKPANVLPLRLSSLKTHLFIPLLCRQVGQIITRRLDDLEVTVAETSMLDTITANVSKRLMRTSLIG